MTLETQKKRMITISDFLIIIAFITNIISFAYQHINARYTVSELFGSAGGNISTAPRNNFIVSGLFLVFMLCFFFAALLALTKKKKLNHAMLCILVLIVFGVFWTILAATKISIVTVVKSPISPVVMIMSVCVFIGYDERAWETVKKMAFIASFIYTLMATYEMLRFLIVFGFGSRLMLSGALYGIIAAIFLAYFTLLFNEEALKKHKFILAVQLVTILSIVVILQSRSWVVHALILFGIFVIQLSKRHKHKVAFFIGVGILALLIVILMFDYFIKMSQGLLDRIGHDSRTGQLEAFFSQVSFKDLMLGKGMQAGYACFGDQNYQFLDNLLLLNMFKYGIVPTIAYLMLMIVPIFYGLTHRKSEASKGIFFFVAWIVIMCGFAIFVSYSNNTYNFLIYITMGRFIFLRERDKAESKSLKLNANARK